MLPVSNCDYLTMKDIRLRASGMYRVTNGSPQGSSITIYLLALKFVQRLSTYVHL